MGFRRVKRKTETRLPVRGVTEALSSCRRRRRRIQINNILRSVSFAYRGNDQNRTNHHWLRQQQPDPSYPR